MLKALREEDMPLALELGRRRLEALPADRWALRLEVATLPSTLKHAVEAFPSPAPDLYIAPIALRGGKSAYQLFMGDYPSKAEAEKAARSVPPAFLQGGQRPLPQAVSGIRQRLEQPMDGAGAQIQLPPPSAPLRPVPTPAPAPAPAQKRGGTINPLPAQKPGQPERVDALRRGDLEAAVDLGRKHIDALPPRRWTLALETAALPSTLKRAAEAFPDGSPDLYIVPTKLSSGKKAYQVFLGDYASKEEAEQAVANVPQVFLQRGHKPKPHLIAAIPRPAASHDSGGAQKAPQALAAGPSAQEPSKLSGPSGVTKVPAGSQVSPPQQPHRFDWLPWLAMLVVVLLVGATVTRSRRRRTQASLTEPRHPSGQPGPE